MKVTLVQGSVPVLISFPHSGTYWPPELTTRLTKQALVLPDTAEFLPELFDFARGLGCWTITANFARYLMDVDEVRQTQVLDVGPARSPLCPVHTADDAAIYLAGEEPDQFEVGQRTADYWQPFHDDLQEALLKIKHRFGVAVLLNVKSTDVDSLTANLDVIVCADVQKGCDDGLYGLLEQILGAADQFSSGVEESQSGRYIISHYGNPPTRIHAVDLLVARESQDSVTTQSVLRRLVLTCIDWAKTITGS